MLPFGVTIPATVPQISEIPEGHMNYPVLKHNGDDSPKGIKQSRTTHSVLVLGKRLLKKRHELE
jgi:hypothetical protein